MKIFNDFNLLPYNSYQLDAVCKTAYFPENDEDIRTLFKGMPAGKIILGGGYNVILSKSYYDEEFVIFSGTYDAISLQGEDELLVEAGVDMKTLSEYALAHGLSGLEIYYDIPSSLGGAVVMNAGAGGEDIKALLKNVFYYDPKADQFHVIETADIDFEYRNSFFQKNPHLVICRALLKLKKGDPTAIKAKMDATKEARWNKQPREFPNAGSVFKRPAGYYVGAIMDELNLKGYTVGGAKISEKHGGFIVNFNQAKGEDILNIINHVQNKVNEKYGFELEVEQRII